MALTCLASLCAGVAWFGRPTLEYEQLSWFQPLFAAAIFASTAGFFRRPRAWLGFPAALVALLAIAPELWRASGQFLRKDPLLAFIDESQPLWRDPRWALQLLGVGLIALPWALAAGVRGARSGDLRLVPAITGTLVFTAGAAVQARFVQPLSGALALLIPLAAPYGFPSRLRRAAFGVVAAGALTLGFGLVPRPFTPPDDLVTLARPTLRWMREHLPAASADPYGPAPARYGIAADPLLGNLLLLWAERPALGTMFSQAAAHLEGNARDGAILAAEDDDTGFAKARAAGARYVLAIPSATLFAAEAFDPHRALLDRLADRAGIEDDPRRTTGHFRLVHESSEPRRTAPERSYARVFEAVEGAVFTGTAAPGAPVTARVQIQTDQGRTVTWIRTVDADAYGHFTLRTPYPCLAPAVTGTYQLSAAGSTRDACPSEADVESGRTLDVGSLSPGS